MIAATVRAVVTMGRDSGNSSESGNSGNSDDRGVPVATVSRDIGDVGSPISQGSHGDRSE